MSALQQTATLLDHLIGTTKERCPTFVPERVKIALNA
jgi:hypothetical protein